MKIYINFFFGLFFALMAAKASANDTATMENTIETNVTGISGKPLQNVEDRLNIKKKAIHTEQPAIVKWRFYQELPKDIKEALEPYGYFRAKVNTSLTRNKDFWKIDINITPGRRLTFTTLNVTLHGEGLNDPSFIKYLKHLPIKAGQNFNSENYEKIKDDLQNIANNNGYFQAHFTESKLSINLENYSSNVIISFDTGSRYHFGTINFSPSEINNTLLQRYLTFNPGDLYNNYLLEESRRNLSNNGYFSQVTIAPNINQADGRFVPIKIDLSPQEQVTYTFGAGYGTDTGVRGMAASHIRWLNASGHSMNIRARASQNNDQVAVSYIIPGTQPAINSYEFNAGLMDINQVTGQAENAQASATYQTKLGEWKATIGLNYLIENYTLNNFPTDDQNTKTDANVIYPQLTLQRLYAIENLINPDYGYNIFFSTAVGNNFKTNNIFSQARIDAKALYTFQKTHTRILLRGSLGSILIDNLTNLPLSMQFYAGGAQSIRGYQYDSIGPGTTLAIASIELQQKIIGKLYLGGFIDTGNVSDNIMHDKLKTGVGPALIYLSPVGAIELSFGRKVETDSWAIQFSMGALL